jgi:hypothetical protein
MSCLWLGVYRTTNGGMSWSQFGAGLPMPADGSFLRASRQRARGGLGA